jgi:predicted DNA binding CopG/RHH family protein
MALRDPLPSKKYAEMTRAELLAIAEKYDAIAEKAKTEMITMRVSPRFKRELKRAADKHGIKSYQRWAQSVLQIAIEQTFPEEYADPGDNF